MVALVCREWGPPASHALEEPLAGPPGPGEVRVQAKAAALNTTATARATARNAPDERQPMRYRTWFAAASIWSAAVMTLEFIS